MGRAFEYRRKAKEKRWGTMSKVFPKIAKAITIAAREGGTDPEANAKLRLEIQNAKAANMPKDNIDSAIKRASGKDAVDMAEVNYEGKGPHGVLVFVETATDNTNRTVANLKTIFNKSGGQMVQTGSLEFLFDRKSVVEFEIPEGKDIEEIELELIDHGLEELEVDENTAYAYAPMADFGRLTSGFEQMEIEVSSAKLQRIPNNPQEFSDEQMPDIDALVEKLEDDEDVQAVYTNIA